MGENHWLDLGRRLKNLSALNYREMVPCGELQLQLNIAKESTPGQSDVTIAIAYGVSLRSVEVDDIIYTYHLFLERKIRSLFFSDA